MKQQRLDEVNTTPNSLAMIRKFLALEAEIHSKRLTPLMIAGYERAFGDVPPETLGPALLSTLRSVQFWPSPGDITQALCDLASERATLRSLPSGCVSDEGTTWKLLKGCAECDALALTGEAPGGASSSYMLSQEDPTRLSLPAPV